MYAAAIEAERGAGEEPSSLLLESWAKYAAAADSDDPGQAFAPVPPPHPTPSTKGEEPTICAVTTHSDPADEALLWVTEGLCDDVDEVPDPDAAGVSVLPPARRRR